MRHIDLLAERYPSLESTRNDIVAAYLLLEESYKNGGKLLVAGNGGSAADAEHIVGELMKGFKLPRKPEADFAEKLVEENQELGSVLAENLQGALPAIALDGHPALSTAYMNDCEPLLCFAQQVNGYGNEPARIVIGKDTRRSSYMFEYSLVAGLTASGADAYLLHVTTTPSVAYIARVDDFDCGIMISASHNPYYDNGIKLIDCYGEKMPEEILLLVEDYIDGKLHVFDKDWPELPFAHREHIGCTVDYVSGRNRYMGYLISLGIYSFKGVKVGLDCANGSSWNIAKSVFDALGADTYVINAQPNGTNINNNAGSTHIEGLQKFVVEKGLDIGFAYDGDADRCLCVDEKGNVITGDHILYIYGCYMKERGKLLTNTVVTTVMSNFGLYKAFDEKGIGYAKTAVGDKYVYEYMAKNGCRIGGEQSGHIIFSKYASTGDGILTSLKMMEVMLAKKLPMSKLAEPLKIYPQVLENVRVTDKKAAQDDEAVQAAVKAVAEALGDTGRILVRESGTEPVVRVMVEAPDHDTCQKYVSQVVETIKSRGYGV